ncbi:MAG: MFS transporter [Burkholderiales bacterium]|nr:MFS transporter [Burkholderiales bacterium]
MCCDLLYVSVHGLPAVYAGAALAGAALVFMQISAHSLTGALGEGAARTRNFSILALSMSVTDFIGPVVAGLAIDAFGHVKAYLCLGATSIAGVLVALYFFRRMPRSGRASGGGQSQGAFDLLRSADLRRILLASAMVMTGIDLFQLYLPLYGHAVALSATAIGLIMGACAVAGFVARLAIPLLSRKFTERRVLIGSLFLAAAAFSLIPLFSHAWLLGAVAFILGLGLGLGQPLTLVLIYNSSPPGRSGEALGLRLTVSNLMHVVMPVLFGIMGSMLGISWVFWITAAILVTGAHFSRKGRSGR